MSGKNLAMGLVETKRGLTFNFQLPGNPAVFQLCAEWSNSDRTLYVSCEKWQAHEDFKHGYVQDFTLSEEAAEALAESIKWLTN